MGQKHRTLVNDIISELNIKFLHKVRVDKRIVGKFRMPNSEQRIKVGHPGQADITGAIKFKNSTEILEIEAKTEDSPTRTKEQKDWAKHCKIWGKHYLLAMSVKEAVDFVEELLKKHDQS